MTVVNFSGGTNNNITQATAIASTINLHDDFTATNSGTEVVIITQNNLGSAGNTSITLADNGGSGDISAAMTVVNFTGGKGASPPQNENSLWWKERAERSGPDLTSGDAATDSNREALRKIAVYQISASAPHYVSLNPGAYESSKYIVRTLPKLYNFSARVESAIRNGRVSFVRHNKDYYKSRIDFGATTGLEITNAQAEKDISDVIDKPKQLDKKRKRLTAGGDRNERFAPFSVFSSSVPSGYASKFNASNFMAGVDITNNHEDKVMFSEDIPMQGPFSERFVGGSAHRHTDLNKGSDSATDRTEAYDLDFAAGKITVRHQEVHQPRSSLYREEMAKRPVTFKNIRQSTSSVTNEISGTLHAPVGNFSKTYEIVMAGDRGTNNSAFVKAEGFGSSSEVSSFVSSLNDYTSPVRQIAGHTIASRFSAPGGPETSAQCFLDLESGQYSPYNDLNTRNWGVRKPLRDLLSEKVERFGIRSGSSVATGYNAAAAFHKTNRNPLKRREYVNSTTVTSISSTYDNYFVQHPIPRSDTQYAWISASYESVYVYGHAHPDGMHSGTMGVGMVPSILFVTASNIAYGGLPVDHVGLNQLIYEPISSSDARVGYPHGLSSANYKNTAVISIGSAYILNSLLLHRRGIYGNPSWSQIANESKPLVRKWRRDNTLAFNTTPGEVIVNKKSSASASFSTKQNRFSALKIFTEPPVTSRNYPLKFVLDVNTKQGDKTARINSVFGNEVDNFTNYPLNRQLDMTEQDGVAYNKIKDLYLNGALGSSSSPVEGFRSLTYKQTVFPKAQNSFLAKTRSRPGYRNNFWKTSRTDRDTLGGSKFGAPKSTTGGGLPVSILSGAYSSWNMDADTNVITVITGTTAGILQNNKTFFHNGTKTAITASIKFHNAHDVDSTGSVRTRTGMPVPETGTLDQVDLIPGYRLGKMLIGGGNALWEVGDQAGYYDLDGTWVSSPSYPWNDSYDGYVGHMRAHNKDFSIVPEFRISEHIDKYVSNSGDNFLTNNASFLSIAGATSSHPQNSSEDDFYKVYSNSDFMQQFDIIREDHRGFVSPTEVKLTCKAIKKFVPYSGFYPSELLVDLYSQFSSSYGRNVSYSGADLAKSNARIRPFIMPMFAPGIWCNMVKSGIAVDWPVYTGSYGVLQPWGGSHISSYHLIGTASSPGSVGAGGVTDSKAANWDLRVPFEAIIKPEDYLSKISLVDMVPHPSASMNITASWSGDGNKLYKMKAHNALASMIEFFLPGENNKGELSTIVSSPEKDWKPFVSGTAYGMRVKLKKSYNKDRQLFQAATGSYLANAGLAFPTPHDTRIDIQNGLRQTLTICSRPSSFGPAVHGRRGIYQAGRRHTAFSASLDSLTGVNPAFTPPYYDGVAWCDFVYVHLDNEQPTLEKIQRKAKMTNWRWDAQALSASNGGSNKGPYGPGNINTFSMQLTSSINVLGKKRIPTVTFGPSGEEISSVRDTLQGTNAWCIQPKMEVPVLNLHGTPITAPTYASGGAAPRSIWSQFGRIPTGSHGLYLEVGSIDRRWIKKRLPAFANLGASCATDQGGVIGNPPNWTTKYAQRYGGTKGVKMASLADQIGFKGKGTKLGKLSKSRIVKEAIVAIPFIERSGKRNFFEISKKAIEQSLSSAAKENSVTEMVSKMKDYVFPPKFDFIKYPEEITPFAMYIFEFKHKFDQNDLSYIWQGIQPRSSAKLKIAASTIKHKLLAKELMGKAKEETGEPLQSELRWMVFKVKQKSPDNYYDKTIVGESSKGNKGIEESEIPEYSYNWPYDYFSLVEFAKIESEVRFAPTKSGLPSSDLDDTEDDTPDSFVISSKVPCPETDQFNSSEFKNSVESIVKQVSEDLLK